MRRIRLPLLLLLGLGLAVPAVVQAKLLQIIHTNDLHSHMEQAGADAGVGGFAAVRARIDQLKFEAESQGIPTLILDAGDFSEGTEFFFADEGRQSWRAINAMGYDAVALGNHDYQVGTSAVDGILGHVIPEFALLGANFWVEPRFANFSRYLKPFAEFIRGGIKVAVLGLTTNEMMYRWAALPGAAVKSPIQVANGIVPELKASNDMVIALTHLGVDADVQLVKNVEGIDLVVGGHSHTKLDQAVQMQNKAGKVVPIVQTGEHGRFVGDLLVDVEPGRDVQVLRYALQPVARSFHGENGLVADVVRETRELLEQRYGASWLYEPIGETKVPMARPFDSPSRWGSVFAQAMREVAQADVGLDVGEFFGPTQPAGPITREKLMQFYPRTFDVAKPLGWNVWTVEIHGLALREAITLAFNKGRLFAVDNITYDVKVDQGRAKLFGFKIGGEKLKLGKRYTVATSEGVGKGGKKINWFLKQYLHPKDIGVPIWTAVEGKIRALGGVVEELNPAVRASSF